MTGRKAEGIVMFYRQDRLSRWHEALVALSLLFSFGGASVAQVLTVRIDDLETAARLLEGSKGLSAAGTEPGRRAFDAFVAATGWPEPWTTIDIQQTILTTMPYEGIALGAKGLVYLLPAVESPEAVALLEEKAGTRLDPGTIGQWEAPLGRFHLTLREGYWVAGFNRVFVERLDVGSLLESSDPLAPRGAITARLDVEEIYPWLRSLAALAPPAIGEQEDSGGPDPGQAGAWVDALGVVKTIEAAALMDGGRQRYRLRILGRGDTWIETMAAAQLGGDPPRLDALDPAAALSMAYSLKAPDSPADLDRILSLVVRSSALPEALVGAVRGHWGECAVSQWQMTIDDRPDRQALAWVGEVVDADACASVPGEVLESLPDPFESDAPQAGGDEPPAPRPRLAALDSDTLAFVLGRYATGETLEELLRGRGLPPIGEWSMEGLESLAREPGFILLTDPVRQVWNRIPVGQLSEPVREEFARHQQEWLQQGGPVASFLGFDHQALLVDITLSPVFYEYYQEAIGFGLALAAPDAEQVEAPDEDEAEEPADADRSRPIYQPGVDGVSDPELIPSSWVAPRYPLRARWRKLEGKVILSAVVEADGRVSSVEVVSAPEPDRGLVRSAIRAVRKWRYRPALLEGRPVACHITVVVNFNIEESAAEPASSASHQRRSDS